MEGFDARHVMATRIAREWDEQAAAPERSESRHESAPPSVVAFPRPCGSASSPQPLHLLPREPPALPLPEPTQAQRPEGDPLQLDDAVADGLAHAPHLTLAALAQLDLEHARWRRGAPAPAQ